MPKRIYVTNLPGTATASEIKSLFAPFGKVGNVQIEGTGRMMVATVEMLNDTEATSALRGLENTKMGTNILNVAEARPRTG